MEIHFVSGPVIPLDGARYCFLLLMNLEDKDGLEIVWGQIDLFMCCLLGVLYTSVVFS